MADENIGLIIRSLEHGSLDYKWLSRNYINFAPPVIVKTLRDIADSSFRYLDEHKAVLTGDSSLAAIIRICNDRILMRQLEFIEGNLFFLSRMFNQVSQSGRKLLECYDCGTNARAMFLMLLKTHRGALYLSHEEQVRMQDEYRLDEKDPIGAISECQRRLESMTKDCIFIMSFSIQEFGHVWIVEKRFINGKPRYHHYQSSLTSHLILDFIEDRDYGRDPGQSLDTRTFFDDFRKIMSVKRVWRKPDYKLFCKLFAFYPVNPVTDPYNGFSYTYIVYDDVKVDKELQTE